MSLKIHPINLGNFAVEGSALVLFRNPGQPVTIPVLAFLITGGTEPLLVDTGARNLEAHRTAVRNAEVAEEMRIDHHLSVHGLKRSDIRCIVHTHAHFDHVGQDDTFPMTTQVCLARREMAFMASGVMKTGTYSQTDTKHLIDRLHTPAALRLFDVDGSFEEEIIPGVAVRLTGAHTPGSISVLVETDEGLANICGDVVYNIHDQLVAPSLDHLAQEPTITGNHAMRPLEEKRGIKRALAGTRFLLPSHDAPALVECGRIVGRSMDAISNPATDVTRADSYTPTVA